MIKNKKIIIFDLDQTLIDSIDVWNNVDIELVKRISGQVIEFSEINVIRDAAMDSCLPGEDKYLKYFAALAKKYHSNLTPGEISKLNDDVALDQLRYSIDYKKNAEVVIKFLKDKGYTLVMATTSPNYMVDIYRKENSNIMKKANIDQFFDKIYTKDDVKLLKPDSEVYLNILKDYNCTPEECIAIEDSIEGIKASKGALIDTIAFYDKGSDKYRDQINMLSDYQINDYDTMLTLFKGELDEEV